MTEPKIVCHDMCVAQTIKEVNTLKLNLVAMGTRSHLEYVMHSGENNLSIMTFNWIFVYIFISPN